MLPSVHSAPHWYNNDLGQTIDKPLVGPAGKRAYKEGGSFDFLVSHCGRNYLIRPSYHYLEGQLDGIRADVLFLGIGGLSKDSEERRAAFFAETIDKVQPQVVVPVHWDNFFSPLFGEVRGMPGVVEHTGRAMQMLTDAAEEEREEMDEAEEREDPVALRNARFLDISGAFFAWLADRPAFRVSEFVAALPDDALYEFCLENALPQVIMQLYALQTVSITDWKGAGEMIVEPLGEFELPWCLSRLPGAYLELDSFTVTKLERTFSFSVSREGRQRSISMSDFLVEVKR